jgi:hypothetical protein
MVLDMDALFTEGRGTVREPVRPFLREIGKAAAKGNLAVRIMWPFGSASGPATRPFPGRPPALRAASLIQF